MRTNFVAANGISRFGMVESSFTAAQPPIPKNWSTDSLSGNVWYEDVGGSSPESDANLRCVEDVFQQAPVPSARASNLG